MTKKSFLKLKICYFIVMFFGIGFIMLELIAHIFFNNQVSGIAYHPNEGWRYKNNCYEKERFISLTQETIVFSTNKHGFRDDEHMLQKDDMTERIMFLGDSYTAGVYVSDSEIFTNVFKPEFFSEFDLKLGA